MARIEFDRRTLLAGVACTPLLASLPACTRTKAPDPWEEAAAIRARIRPPRFDTTRPVRPQDFGGVADGKTLATDAFRLAVAAASKVPGGGRVLVEGEWLTGPIRLESNVELHVTKGSALRFSTDHSHYFPPVLTRFEGNELMGVSPFIYAQNCENVAITGEGTLDGQASDENWWNWLRTVSANGERDSDRLKRIAEEGVPVEKRVFGPDTTIRAQFIQPYRCRNVLIEDVTIIRSPMWEIHPIECDNVTVRRVKIDSHGPNNDGCDPESCRDVLIEDCVFDTGDDCIAVKSGRNADGRRIKRPTENIIISGCKMVDGHGGVTLGSEITGGVRNVFVERCQMDSPNLNTALRFKNNAARGGTLENIHFRDIAVGQVAHAAITIDYNYNEGAQGGFIPVFRGMTIERLTVAKCQRVLDLQGFANAPIRDIVLRDCTITHAAEPDVVAHVDGLRYENVKRNGVAVTGPTPGGVVKPASQHG